MMFGAIVANAANSVCSGYIQTWSSAGQCASCKLAVNFDEARGKYVVQANNGWKAELYAPREGKPLAVGTGHWNEGLGHIYAGHDFDMAMSFRDDQPAMMMMVVPIDGQRLIIRATFRCENGADL